MLVIEHGASVIHNGRSFDQRVKRRLRSDVHSQKVLGETVRALSTAAHRPAVTIKSTGTVEDAMIDLTTGDILKAAAEAIVNTVNCDDQRCNGESWIVRVRISGGSCPPTARTIAGS